MKKFLFHILFFSLYRFLILPLFIITLFLLNFFPLSFPLFSHIILKAKALFQLKNRFSKKLSQAKLQMKDKKLNCVWFHCASGEFEYAKPVIRTIKQKNRNISILVTFFSPSYEKFIQQFPGVDFCLPLPWDLPGPLHSLIKTFRPKWSLIARTDLWPEMLNQCKKNQVPCFLFSATCSSSQCWPQNFYYSWMYSFLSGIFCISSEDKKNFQTKTSLKQIYAIGDTRYDQVIERLTKSKEELSLIFEDSKDLKNSTPLEFQKNSTQVKTHLSLFFEKLKLLKINKNIPCLVAGSTWREDEEVLLEALHPFVKQKKLQILLAPHEPHPFHLENLTQTLSKYHLKFQRLSLTSHSFLKEAKNQMNLLDNENTIWILDEIGVLAETYLIGNLAFVGGSFKKSVHSVMEPLAAGCLTFVGPYHEKNREVSHFEHLTLKEKKTTHSSLKQKKIPLYQKATHIHQKEGSDSFSPLKMLYSFKNTEEIKKFFHSYSLNFYPETSRFHKEQIISEVKKKSGAASQLLDYLNHKP